MHVKFGLHFDGLQPQRPTNAAGMVTLGPSGLLGVLDNPAWAPALSRAERNQTKGRSKTLPPRPSG